jgi:hypothetical protein
MEILILWLKFQTNDKQKVKPMIDKAHYYMIHNMNHYDKNRWNQIKVYGWMRQIHCKMPRPRLYRSNSESL